MNPNAMLTSSSEALRHAERLLEINVTLNSTRDPEELLPYIVETEVLDCEAASL